MRIIVTDGEQRSSLAVVRSLAASGHMTSVGAVRQPCLAGVSKDAKIRFCYSDPSTDKSSFIDDICAECVRFGADLIMPLTDATCFAMAAYADRITEHSLLFQPPLESLRRAADKLEIAELAKKLKIPVPATTQAATPGDDLHGIPYPIVIKPRRSRVIHKGRLIALGVSYAHDESTLRSTLESLPSGAFPVLLQEKLCGDGVGYFALAKDGVILAEFFHRRLRELPPTGGVSVLRESISPDEKMQSAGHALLRDLHWTGPAMVEFKRDANGVAKIMEINGRFWGSLQLAVDAGVDFPSLLAQAAVGESFDPPAFRFGERSRYLLGDIEALAVGVVKGGSSLPAQNPTRLAVIKHFFSEGGRLEVFSIADMKPFFHDLAGFLCKTFRLIFRHTNFRPLQGIVHCHTTFSHDGQMSPEQLAVHLKKEGLSFVAITEHEDSMSEKKMKELVAACRQCSRPGFTMLPGVEFATKHSTHILGIGIERFFVEHDPVKIVSGIHAQGGLAVLAHPDAGNFEKDEEFLKALDGVEVWNSVHDGPFVPSLKNIKALREIRKVNPKITVFGGNDFHRKGHYRNARLVLQDASQAEIIEDLKTGRFKIKGTLLTLESDDAVGSVRMTQIKFIRLLIDLYRPILSRWRIFSKK